MVEIDWGNMLFTYNLGKWDTETLTLTYNDDPATLHWGTSFDGTNNQVTVINRSSNPIDTTLKLALNQDQQTVLASLSFYLTKGNTNDNLNNYPTTAQTLQSGSAGNFTTAYVNIGANELTPPNDYNTETPIGNITVQNLKS